MEKEEQTDRHIDRAGVRANVPSTEGEAGEGEAGTVRNIQLT